MALLEVLEFDDRLALFIAGIDAALLFWLLKIGVDDWCMGQPSCGAKVSALRCLVHVQRLGVARRIWRRACTEL